MNKALNDEAIVGGVDTHKDLHVAAVVDAKDRYIASNTFATTRQGYRLMLEWMRSFGEVQRVGVEATGTYGEGLLHICKRPESKFWKLLGQTNMIGARAANQMYWMRKRLPMQRLLKDQLRSLCHGTVAKWLDRWCHSGAQPTS